MNLKIDLPISSQHEAQINPFKEILNSILYFYLSGGSLENFSKMVSRTADSSKSAAAPFACGHIFRKGEGVYRCIDCGLDDTCVMCLVCFKSSNHKGHQVSVHYSSGSGGCCDCGDKEAWKVPGTCSIHNSTPDTNQELESLPEDLVASISSTITAALDFCTSNIVACTEPPSPILPTQNKLFFIPPIPPHFKNENSQDLYSLLLWNDESHSFNEVIETVQEVLFCTREHAKKVAETVDSHGRFVVCEGVDVDLLQSAGRKLARVGLRVSISPSKVVLMEEICASTLEWLSTLSSSSESAIKNPQVLSCVLSSLAKEMAAPYTIVPTSSRELYNVPECRVEVFLVLMRNLWKDMIRSVRRIIIGLLIHSDTTKRFLCEKFGRVYLDLANHNLNDPEPNHKVFEWHSLSLAVQLFTVPSLSYFIISKSSFCERLCLLIKAFYMEESFFLEDVGLEGPLDLQDHFYASLQVAQKVKDFKVYIQSEFDGSSATSIRFTKHLTWINDLQHVYTALSTFISTNRDGIDDFGGLCRQIVGESFLDLLGFTQGMNHQHRAVGTHVEYEVDSWINAFNSSAMLMRAIKSCAESWTCLVLVASSRPSAQESTSELILVFETLVKTCFEWAAVFHTVRQSEKQGLLCNDSEGSRIEILGYRGYCDEFSIHFPLYWLLASFFSALPRLVRLLNYDTVKLLVTDCFQVFQKVSGLFGDDKWTGDDVIKMVFDSSIQSLAFIAQVRANVWVRNGRSIRLQAAHYRDLSLRDAFDYDVYMVQIGVVLIGGEYIVPALVDRFGLLEAFRYRIEDDDSLDHNPDEPAKRERFPKEQELGVLEDFLHVLILVLSERTTLSGMSGAEQLRHEMIHQLAAAGKTGLSYSTLEGRLEFASQIMETRKTEADQSFDQLLYSISHFRYPEGITDSGVYTLKEEFLEEVDPWFWHFSRNQREEVEAMLAERVKKLKATETVNESKSLNLPRLKSLAFGFEQVGSLVHSKSFNRVLFFALWDSVYSIFENPGAGISGEQIVASVVQLILIAITIVKTENPGDGFVVNASTKKHVVSIKRSDSDTPISRETSLLDIVLSMIDHANHSEIKEHAPRLRYIIRSFEEIGGDNVRFIISGWRDKSQWDFFSISTKAVPSEDALSSTAEQRKRASKARQAAIMAQFAKAQSTFKANFGDELMDGDEDAEQNEPNDSMDVDPATQDQERTWLFPVGSCIICQEDVKESDKLYGLLCHLQLSHIQRQVDVTDIPNLTRVFSCPTSLDQEAVKKAFVPVTAENINTIPEDDYDESENTFRNGSKIFKKGVVPTTCGHVMHISCLDSYLSSIQSRQSMQPLRNHPENLELKEFLCPLCKTLGNGIYPILWKSKKEVVNTTLFNDATGALTDDQYRLVSLHNFLTKDFPKYLNLTENKQDHTPQEAGLPGSFPGELDSKTPPLAYQRVHSSMSSLIESDVPESKRLEVSSAIYDRYILSNIRALLRNPDAYTSRAEQGMTSSLQIWELFQTLVCSIEITARGASNFENEKHIFGKSSKIKIFDQINPNQLSLLRVIAESGISSMLLKINSTSIPLDRMASEIIKCALGSPGEMSDSDPILLLKDGFSHLVRASMAVASRRPEEELQVFQFISLYGFVEIVRSIVSVIEALLLHGNDWMTKSYTITQKIPAASFKPLSKLIHNVCGFLGTVSALKKIDSANKIAMIYHLLSSNILIYTRKAILLLYSRFGIIPSEKDLNSDPMNSESELLRNLEYLGMPSIGFMLEALVSPDAILYKMSSNWCEVLRSREKTYWSSLEESNFYQSALVQKKQRITLDQPIIFELSILPNRLESLFERALNEPCAKCKTVPHEPAMCLLCGLILCGQTQCCSEEDVGECNLHMKTCGGIGIFFSIKQCSLVMLSNGNGCFASPPYLDIHGEVDKGLRRGQPQFLNYKRYGEYRKIWLNHGIPSIIARYLEQRNDVGGWSTF